MLLRQPPHTYTTEQGSITPGLINTRQIFDPSFHALFSIQTPEGKREPLENIAPYAEEWEQHLRTTLLELLDPKVDFEQTEHLEKCVTCPYKGICQRH